MEETVKKVKRTATDDVLNYLKTHNGITQNECTEKFGATRLADIVFRLKKKGHSIGSRDKDVITRYGKHTICSEYYLRD